MRDCTLVLQASILLRLYDLNQSEQNAFVAFISATFVCLR